MKNKNQSERQLANSNPFSNKLDYLTALVTTLKVYLRIQAILDDLKNICNIASPSPGEPPTMGGVKPQ